MNYSDSGIRDLAIKYSLIHKYDEYKDMYWRVRLSVRRELDGVDHAARVCFQLAIDRGEVASQRNRGVVQ